MALWQGAGRWKADGGSHLSALPGIPGQGHLHHQKPGWGQTNLGRVLGALGVPASPPVISALSRYLPPQPFLGPETLCTLHRHIAKSDGKRKAKLHTWTEAGAGREAEAKLVRGLGGTWECLCFSSGPGLHCYQVKLFLLPLAVPPTQTGRSKQRPLAWGF